MGADELDAFLFEIAVSEVGQKDDLSFDERVAEIAGRSAGNVVCNVRLDGDPQFQRIAVIKFPRGGVGILALGNDGLSVGSSTANEAFSRFIDPLAEWHRLPLREQAVSDIRGHATLFVAALRNAGLFCMSVK